MKSVPQGLAQLLLRPSVVCAWTGFLLGQVILALAARHEHQPSGFAYALVVVLAGAASLACFLKHQHDVGAGAQQAAPVRRWLMILGAGVLASVNLSTGG